MLSKEDLHVLHKNLYAGVEEYRTSGSVVQFKEAAAKYTQNSNHSYVPFHADLYNLSLVHHLIENKDVDMVCELGTYYGGTAYYVGNCLETETHTCEPYKRHHIIASENLSHLPTVTLYRERSLEFLERAPVPNRTPLFYVDSHGYGFDLEIAKEIESILSKHTSGFILIDDFKIPDQNQFGYEQNVEMSTIQSVLTTYNCKTVYMSNQTDVTSPVHGLRGYVLIPIGTASLSLPENVKMQRYTV